jgi:hypothetical protein
MEIGIACSAGSYKGVFVHGVLAAFEDAGFKAQMYAACSSSALPAAFASFGQVKQLHGTGYWKEAYSRYVQSNYDISKAMLRSLPEAVEALDERLFAMNAARYAVAVSAVVTKEAAELTQGSGARLLGMQLLRAMKNRDRSWAEKHLQLRFFRNRNEEDGYVLNPKNLKDVFYATTRMLHAWRTPAWIEGEPYIDASYTCICPAIELVQRGCNKVIAVSPEHGEVYRDLFQVELMPTSHNSVPIDMIQPQNNLAEIGVDYMKVTDEGLEAGFELGRQAGNRYLAPK